MRILQSFLHNLAAADPRWLWLSGLGFVAALVGSAGAWRSAAALNGARTTLLDAIARYGAGSLVNTFIPFHAGDAVRVGLFSRLIPHGHRVRMATTTFVAVGAARSVVLTAVVAAGALAGAVPLWPLGILAGVAAVAVVAARITRKRLPDPRQLPRLLGWMSFSTGARLLAATAACAALGIHAPLAAAIIVLAALEVAALFPVTPGGIGIVSGTMALALEAHGTSFHDGLAAGVAFHGAETIVGLLVGSLSTLYLAPGRPLTRKVAYGLSAAGVAAAFGVTVVAPLV